jgi:hypothetical protein
LEQVLKEIGEVKYINLDLDSDHSGYSSINCAYYTFFKGKGEKQETGDGPA